MLCDTNYSSTNQNEILQVTHPLPRPATYEAGAGMDKKASLLGLLDAIFDFSTPTHWQLQVRSQAYRHARA